MENNNQENVPLEAQFSIGHGTDEHHAATEINKGSGLAVSEFHSESPASKHPAADGVELAARQVTETTYQGTNITFSTLYRTKTDVLRLTRVFLK